MSKVSPTWDALRSCLLPSSASTSTPTLAEVSLILEFIFPPTHQPTIEKKIGNTNKQTNRQTNRNWHVGPVLTLLALDKNKICQDVLWKTIIDFERPCIVMLKSMINTASIPLSVYSGVGWIAVLTTLQCTVMVTALLQYKYRSRLILALLGNHSTCHILWVYKLVVFLVAEQLCTQ